MSRTAAELAEYVGGRLEGDPGLPISGIASPERAGGEDLIYLDSPRHADRAAESAACCVLVPEGVEVAGKTTIASRNPKLAFAKAAPWLLVAKEHRVSIHPTAIIGDDRKTRAECFGWSLRGNRGRRGSAGGHRDRSVLLFGPRQPRGRKMQASSARHALCGRPSGQPRGVAFWSCDWRRRIWICVR